MVISALQEEKIKLKMKNRKYTINYEKKWEWIAYIVNHKLAFLFNREGKVYTGDLCKKF